ncbi:uncharacterized protein LOC5521307 [Nematostella vectensis]|nr:uncharacterized protein LOC5521307 [Nematostella vectensis]
MGSHIRKRVLALCALFLLVTRISSLPLQSVYRTVQGSSPWQLYRPELSWIPQQNRVSGPVRRDQAEVDGSGGNGSAQGQEDSDVDTNVGSLVHGREDSATDENTASLVQGSEDSTTGANTVSSFHGSVDNTDLSLEQPDLPSDENFVVKEEVPKLSDILPRLSKNATASAHGNASFAASANNRDIVNFLQSPEKEDQTLPAYSQGPGLSSSSMGTTDEMYGDHSKYVLRNTIPQPQFAYQSQAKSTVPMSRGSQDTRWNLLPWSSSWNLQIPQVRSFLPSQTGQYLRNPVYTRSGLPQTHVNTNNVQTRARNHGNTLTGYPRSYPRTNSVQAEVSSPGDALKSYTQSYTNNVQTGARNHGNTFTGYPRSYPRTNSVQAEVSSPGDALKSYTQSYTNNVQTGARNHGNTFTGYPRSYPRTNSVQAEVSSPGDALKSYTQSYTNNVQTGARNHGNTFTGYPRSYPRTNSVQAEVSSPGDALKSYTQSYTNNVQTGARNHGNTFTGYPRSYPRTNSVQAEVSSPGDALKSYTQSYTNNVQSGWKSQRQKPESGSQSEDALRDPQIPGYYKARASTSSSNSNIRNSLNRNLGRVYSNPFGKTAQLQSTINRSQAQGYRNLVSPKSARGNVQPTSQISGLPLTWNTGALSPRFSSYVQAKGINTGAQDNPYSSGYRSRQPILPTKRLLAVNSQYPLRSQAPQKQPGYFYNLDYQGRINPATNSRQTQNSLNSLPPFDRNSAYLQTAGSQNSQSQTATNTRLQALNFRHNALVEDQFEDAVLESKESEYQSLPEEFQANNSSSLSPTNFTRVDYGKLFSPQMQYSPGGDGSLGYVRPKGDVPRKGYGMYKAAIYLADLLKNASARMDDVSSGDNDIPDDLTGGAVSQGSGGEDDILVDSHTPKEFTDTDAKLLQGEGSGSQHNVMRGGSGAGSGNLKESALQIADQTADTQPSIVTAANEQNSELTAGSQLPSDQALLAQQPSDQALLTQQPSDQAMLTQQPSEQVLMTQQPSDQASYIQQPNDQASFTQQTSDQALIAPQPSDSALFTPQPSSFASQPSDQSSFTQQPSDQALFTSQPFSTQQQYVHASFNQQPSSQAPQTQQFSDQAYLTNQPSDQALSFQSSKDQSLTFNDQTSQPGEQAPYLPASEQPSNQALRAPQGAVSYASPEVQSEDQQASQQDQQVLSSYSVPGTPPGTYRRIVCQNATDTIQCPNNERINILNAEYGDMEQSNCYAPQNDAMVTPQTCQTPGAYESVKTNCDDMENCQLSANNELFGDECESDRKYLDVTYNCLPGEGAQQAQSFSQGQPPQQPQQQAFYQQQQPALPAYAAPAVPQYPAQAPMTSYAPAPALPNLMSSAPVYQASPPPQCDICNTCNQCEAASYCQPCPSCQSMSCPARPPQLPGNLQPLWQLWNEKTADMNSMEMSALIFSPVPKLPPTPKSSSVTEAEASGSGDDSGDENSDKRSHIIVHKKHTKKSHANKPVNPIIKHVKAAKKTSHKTH